MPFAATWMNPEIVILSDKKYFKNPPLGTDTQEPGTGQGASLKGTVT